MLVVSHDGFNSNERYPKVLLIHLTSVRRAGGPFAWEVELPRGSAGLPHTSVAKCAEIYTVLKEQLLERAGALRQEDMERVDRALAVALALPCPPEDE